MIETQIRRLEENLLSRETRSSPAALARLIADDFIEFGASGRIFDKAHIIAALPADIDGAVICLGDMPRVTAALIDRLIDAFDPDAGRAICVPVYRGKRGNPVLWAARFFPEIDRLTGDVGARHLVAAHDSAVFEDACDDDGVLIDVDTPEILARLDAAREAD